MPQANCKNCKKVIRNPPSRKITGYCARCMDTYWFMKKALITKAIPEHDSCLENQQRIKKNG